MVFLTKVLKLAQSAFNPVSHALFDIDGLLLRTYIDEQAVRSALSICLYLINYIFFLNIINTAYIIFKIECRSVFFCYEK